MSRQSNSYRRRAAIGKANGLCICGHKLVSKQACARCLVRNRENVRKRRNSTRRNMGAFSYGVAPLHEQGVHPHLEGR